MSLSAHNAETPWFTPEWYAVVSEDWVQKCIAPKVLPPGSKADRRCKNFIDKEGDLAAVNRLKDEICVSTDPYVVVRKMRELVLLRCCTRGKSSHRGKLDTDAECRRLVAELYIDEFTRLGLLGVSVPRNLMLNDVATIGKLELCPPDEDEVMKTILCNRVDLSPKTPGGRKLPAEGYVYALSTPYPGVVKIGSSGRSGEIRQIEQEACLPGCRLIVQAWFCFPERIEQLIHLQLGAVRRKIMQCENKACRRTHVEFFQLPDKEAKLVIEDWKELSHAEPLYDSEGRLTAAWDTRLQFLAGEPTALSMMAVLKQERQEKEEARLRESARLDEEQRLQNARQLRSRTVFTQPSNPSPERYQTSRVGGRSSLPSTAYLPQHSAALQSHGHSPPPATAYSSLRATSYSPPPVDAYSPPRSPRETYEHTATESRTEYSPPPRAALQTSGYSATVPRETYSSGPPPVTGYGYSPPPPVTGHGYSSALPDAGYSTQRRASQQSYSYSSQHKYAPSPVVTNFQQPYSTTQYSSYDLSSLANTLPSSEAFQPRPRGIFASMAHRFKNPTRRLTKEAS
ncbi:hypothetical protein AMS68_000053 [Peltaster fructicola]|uniref:Bacteriophage T5 Orf172 DNA-binding domain-containing protein n=1 Tax=Peltaster fructicola TaxID=286661 RepID=A0A6H0XIJ2_9PEZI|nr:hypothetical protein AMS68_000053 [Peltaster fructicola]